MNNISYSDFELNNLYAGYYNGLQNLNATMPGASGGSGGISVNIEDDICLNNYIVNEQKKQIFPSDVNCSDLSRLDKYITKTDASNGAGGAIIISW